MVFVNDIHVYSRYFNLHRSTVLYLFNPWNMFVSTRVTQGNNVIPCKLPATLEILILNVVQQFFLRMGFFAQFLEVHVSQLCGLHAFGAYPVVRDVKSGMQSRDCNMVSDDVTVATVVHGPSNRWQGFAQFKTLYDEPFSQRSLQTCAAG